MVKIIIVVIICSKYLPVRPSVLQPLESMFRKSATGGIAHVQIFANCIIGSVTCLRRPLMPVIQVFIKYCVFSLKCCDFSELCQFCCCAGVLPAWCVYTHGHRRKTEKDQSPEYFKILGKNTIFN